MIPVYELTHNSAAPEMGLFGHTVFCEVRK